MAQEAWIATAPDSPQAVQTASCSDQHGCHCDACQSDSWKSRWAGGYAGAFLSLGGGVGVVDRPAGQDEFTIESGGVSAGGLIGYTFGAHQVTANSGWLLGAEAEFSGIGGGSESVNDADLGDVRLHGDWVGSVQLRGGYAWRNTYLYAMTGPAWSDYHLNQAGQNNGSTNGGWAYGVGVEQKLDHEWSARLDVVGYSLDNGDQNLGGQDRNTGIGVGQARLGLTKRF